MIFLLFCSYLGGDYEYYQFHFQLLFTQHPLVPHLYPLQIKWIMACICNKGSRFNKPYYIDRATWNCVTTNRLEWHHRLELKPYNWTAPANCYITSFNLGYIIKHTKQHTKIWRAMISHGGPTCSQPILDQEESILPIWAKFLLTMVKKASWSCE